MGLYELAAIHLSASPPDLVQAALAIDAVACLVDGLGDRLGDEAPTMRDALNNIRLAFVQIKGAVGASRPTEPSRRSVDDPPSRTIDVLGAQQGRLFPTSWARSCPDALTTRHHGTSTSVVARIRPTRRDSFGYPAISATSPYVVTSPSRSARSTSRIRRSRSSASAAPFIPDPSPDEPSHRLRMSAAS